MKFTKFQKQGQKDGFRIMWFVPVECVLSGMVLLLLPFIGIAAAFLLIFVPSLLLLGVYASKYDENSIRENDEQQKQYDALLKAINDDKLHEYFKKYQDQTSSSYDEETWLYIMMRDIVNEWRFVKLPSFGARLRLTYRHTFPSSSKSMQKYRWRLQNR